MTFDFLLRPARNPTTEPARLPAAACYAPPQGETPPSGEQPSSEENDSSVTPVRIKND